jgi:hypothetical protein
MRVPASKRSPDRNEICTCLCKKRYFVTFETQCSVLCARRCCTQTFSAQAQGMALGSHTLLAAENALTFKHTTTTDRKLHQIMGMPHVASRPAHEGVQGAGQTQACATHVVPVVLSRVAAVLKPCNRRAGRARNGRRCLSIQCRFPTTRCLGGIYVWTTYSGRATAAPHESGYTSTSTSAPTHISIPLCPVHGMQQVTHAPRQRCHHPHRRLAWSQ